MVTLQADIMSFPSMDEQERMLKEASTNVKKAAYFMRKALVSSALHGAYWSLQQAFELTSWCDHTG